MWKIHEGNLEKFRPHLDKYLRSLEQRGYPFDRISVQFSGYHTDNSPPAVIECDLVKAWNEKYAWPKLRLSTSQEFLAYVEKEHSAELPVHRQAWPDWWTDGFGSAARETAAARETETAMQVNHGLLAMASILGAQIKSQDHAARCCHSGQPALLRRAHLRRRGEHRRSTGRKHAGAMGRKSLLRLDCGEGFQLSCARKPSDCCRISCRGPTSPRWRSATRSNWSRSGLVRVFIDHEMLPPDREFRILDGAQPVPVQAMERRSEGTYWALWVRDVPPLGFKILRIETSRPTAREGNARHEFTHAGEQASTGSRSIPTKAPSRAWWTRKPAGSWWTGPPLGAWASAFTKRCRTATT